MSDTPEYFAFVIIAFSAACPVLLVGLTSTRKQSFMESKKIGSHSHETSNSSFSLFLMRYSCIPL